MDLYWQATGQAVMPAAPFDLLLTGKGLIWLRNIKGNVILIENKRVLGIDLIKNKRRIFIWQTE